MLISYFSPYNFPYAGYITDSSLKNVDSIGLYWLRTVRSANDAYDLYFDSVNILPARSSNRYGGRSIRCVATT